MDMKDQENMCVVCWRTINVYAVGVCDHPVCHECSTRMRVLCRTNECPICRRDMPKVYFARELKSYEELSTNIFPVELKPQIHFADTDVRKEYDMLLENRCLLCPSKVVFNNFHELKIHMRKEHSKTYCSLCVEHLKIFPFERRVYSRPELTRHVRVGDVDDTSHKGHPICEFCDERYLDNDELYKHLRRDHYYCHFCDADGFHQYYRDYDFLRSHFRKEHYLCEEGDCKTEKFTAAFRNEIDLKAHKALHHTKNMNKAQAKQARTLELEFFIAPRSHQSHQNGTVTSADYEEVHAHNRRGRRGNNRSYRDREPPHPPPDRSEQQTHSLLLGSNRLVDTWEMQPPVNMKSEKEFPQLGSSVSEGAKVPTTSGSGRSVSSNTFTVVATTQPRKGRIDVNSVEEFPSLCSSSCAPSQDNSSISSAKVVSGPQTNLSSPRSIKTLLFRFDNQNSNSKETAKGTPNVSIQLSQTSNAASSNLNTASKVVTTSQSVMLQKQPAFTTTVSSFKTDKGYGGDSSSWVKSSPVKEKKSFAEEFPELTSKSSVTFPVAAVSKKEETSDTAEAPWHYIPKSKSKKKKNNNDTANKNKQLSVGQDSHTTTITTTTSSISSFARPIAKVEENKTSNNRNSFVEVENNNISDSEDFILESFKKNAAALTIDDFPPLSNASGKKSSAPPGFQRSNSGSKPPPPGFIRSAAPSLDNKLKSQVSISLSSVVRPLHGDSSSSSVISPSSMSLTFTNSNGESFPLSSESRVITPEYVQPSDFQQRNLKLIHNIQGILSNDESLFQDFKSLSGKFRQGQMLAAEYFMKCLDSFGQEKFLKFFPELLVLLPDITKQQELLNTFNAFKKQVKLDNTGAIPKNSACNNIQFFVCATCQQVLSRADFRTHMSLHSEN